MKKTDNKATISKFMNKQVEVIYKKYLNISQQEEELANMWIFGTRPREAAKQLIKDEGWMEVIKSEDLGIAYKDKYDCEVYYCINDERRDIFV